MPRYKLTIEYDGKGLAGWQRQENSPSVQQHLEEAVKKFSGETVNIFVAGRTDAGVHATGQVAHFEIKKKFKSERVREAINFYLIDTNIAVTDCKQMKDDFHARFSAKKRHYQYRILNRADPSPLERERTWHIKEKLDIKAMRKAAKLLVGNHDFTSFRSTACQAKSPIKTLDKITIKRVGDEIHVYVSATSFLHNMVRNIVGTLKYVGTGKWTAKDVKKALKARDRRAAGPTAPAWGLYLIKVDY